MMSYKSNWKTGFTLVELLIIISLISLLSSTVLSSLSGAREDAQVVSAASDLKQIETAMTMWMQATNQSEWPRPASDLGTSSGSYGHSLGIDGLMKKTKLSNYLNSVPDTSIGEKFDYHRHTNTFQCGNSVYEGTSIRINQVKNKELAEQINKIIENDKDGGDQDLDCGKLRFDGRTGVNTIYYSLSDDFSF